MKFTGIVLLALSLFAQAALAKDKVLAVYTFAVPEAVGTTVITATALETQADGQLLKVQTADYQSVDVKSKPKAIKLGSVLFGEINQHIQALAVADIETTHASVICKIMVRPFMSFNHLEVTDVTGALKLVAGPQGCWVSDKTYPVEEYNQQDANELKTQMRVLALSVLKK